MTSISEWPEEIKVKLWTDISIATFLDMSLPFRPAFIKASPVHLMIEYVAANARPLKASDANKGAPSSPQLLYRTLKQAAEHASNNQASVPLNSPAILGY